MQLTFIGHLLLTRPSSRNFNTVNNFSFLTAVRQAVLSLHSDRVLEAPRLSDYLR